MSEIEPKIATVTQINGYIKKILEHNIVLNNIWIKGEISNFKAHYSGHLYITLKDENSVLKAVMFKSAARLLNFKPEDGMKVLARGRISAYEAGGVYQLYIEEMSPDGVGALYLAYEQLKRKLEDEGLFSSEYKKEIPMYPEKIGVITATTGAAVRDVINVISRRNPYAKIVIYPSLVQGDGAAANIVKGIEYFNESQMVDTLIVGRGGGSIEDLWAFNEEIVARAIFSSQIPIISAVGHETDFTIADFVADLRAPTPSAAAELSVPSQVEVVNYVLGMKTRISQIMIQNINSLRFELEKKQPKNPKYIIDEYSLKLDHLTKSMTREIKTTLKSESEQFAGVCAKLNAMSPLAVMARGYAIAMKDDGTVVRSVKQVEKNMRLQLNFADGNVGCVVE